MVRRTDCWYDTGTGKIVPVIADKSDDSKHLKSTGSVAYRMLVNYDTGIQCTFGTTSIEGPNIVRVGITRLFERVF